MPPLRRAALLAALLFAPALLAQPADTTAADSSEVVEMESVVVTATRSAKALEAMLSARPRRGTSACAPSASSRP